MPFKPGISPYFSSDLRGDGFPRIRSLLFLSVMRDLVSLRSAYGLIESGCKGLSLLASSTTNALTKEKGRTDQRLIPPMG